MLYSRLMSRSMNWLNASKVDTSQFVALFLIGGFLGLGFVAALTLEVWGIFGMVLLGMLCLLVSRDTNYERGVALVSFAVGCVSAILSKFSGLAFSGVDGVGFVVVWFLVSNAAMLVFDTVKQGKREFWLWFILKREVETLVEWFALLAAALVGLWVFRTYSSEFGGLLKLALLAVTVVAVSVFVLWVKYCFHKGRIKRKEARK